MSWHIFSLVLACATGWSLLFIGYLPVGVTRGLSREPIKGAAVWAVVAGTASAAIFHWYLIFALICLVAWTKLDRPAGKIWLGAAGALGLSLGIVFPLETALNLPPLKSPLPLAALYLSGATSGLSYLVWLRAGLETKRTARRAAAWLVASALGAIALHNLSNPVSLRTASRPGSDRLDPHLWFPYLLAALLFVPAVGSWYAIRRNRFALTRGLAALTGVAAFAASLWFELTLAGSGSGAPR